MLEENRGNADTLGGEPERPGEEMRVRKRKPRDSERIQTGNNDVE